VYLYRYLTAAVADVFLGLRSREIWLLLGWSDIKQRYRRSTLGPFWITLSTAITIAVMGPLYGRLFGQQESGYVAFLAIGMVMWGFISGVITETSTGFISSEGYIKEFNLPLSVFIFRVVWRNFNIFMHNALVMVVVVLINGHVSPWAIVEVPVSILFLLFNTFWLGLLLAVVCARYRDIQQILNNVLQIMFFLTPILWPPHMLGEKAWVLNYNPLYFFIESVRAPMLGNSVSFGIWMGLLITSLGMFFISAVIFGKFRNKIAYWL
jgi:ABC-type polysaccharide/polyol phosphate export permease